MGREVWSILETMRELPLHALRAFASVYSHGGVRAAARELRIAHSSVSRHLAELEEWLGVELTRAGGGRRALAFTAQGEALGRAAQGAFRDLAQAVASLREARSAHAVAVWAPASVAVRWLLPRLPAFEEAFPHLEVSVVVDRRLDDPEAAGINLAVRMGRGPWPGVRGEPLMDDALYPVMSPAFWKKAGRPKEPADLAGLRLLHDRDPDASWEAWRAAHGPPPSTCRAARASPPRIWCCGRRCRARAWRSPAIAWPRTMWPQGRSSGRSRAAWIWARPTGWSFPGRPPCGPRPPRWSPGSSGRPRPCPALDAALGSTSPDRGRVRPSPAGNRP